MSCSNPNCPNLNSTLQVEKSFPCLNCHSHYYCSTKCRSSDWELSHKYHCQNNPLEIKNNVSPQINLNESSSDPSMQKKRKRTIEDYEIVSIEGNGESPLGSGSYGEVRLVREKTRPDKYFALKQINKELLKAYSSVDSIKREIKIHKKLNHPHIIKLYHCFEDKDYVYMVLEYAENGSLFSYMAETKALSEAEAFVYFFQTALGLNYLHKKGIIHRDLKPENLLLSKEKDVKLCDFGWSAEAVGQRNTFCGTVDYMAPEMIRKDSYDYTIDIWSLGVLLYELLHGYTPFKAKSLNEKFRNILDNKPTFGDISAEARDLITSLLNSDPFKRLTFDRIFAHPWLKRFEREFNISICAYVNQEEFDNGHKSASNVTSSPKFAQKNSLEMNLPRMSLHKLLIHHLSSGHQTQEQGGGTPRELNTEQNNLYQAEKSFTVVNQEKILKNFGANDQNFEDRFYKNNKSENKIQQEKSLFNENMPPEKGTRENEGFKKKNLNTTSSFRNTEEETNNPANFSFQNTGDRLKPFDMKRHTYEENQEVGRDNGSISQPRESREEVMRRYKARLMQLQGYEGPVKEQLINKEKNGNKFQQDSKYESRNLSLNGSYQNSARESDQNKENRDYLQEKSRKLKIDGLDWEKILQDPQLADYWLKSQDPKKNLDYSFMPKDLLYTYKTIDQSYTELQKKVQQLEHYFEEDEFDSEKVSRPSYRNEKEIPEVVKEKKKNTVGIFQPIFDMLGCFRRDFVERKDEELNKKKKKEKDLIYNQFYQHSYR